MANSSKDQEVNLIDPLFTVGSSPPADHHEEFFTGKIKAQQAVDLKFKQQREKN